MTFEMRSKFTNQFIKFYVNTVLKTHSQKEKQIRKTGETPQKLRLLVGEAETRDSIQQTIKKPFKALDSETS